MQTQKFTPLAEDLLKATGVSFSSLKTSHQVASVAQHSCPFKTFSIELQNSLISKMSSPLEEVKKEAALRAIKIWEDIPRISSENDLTASNGWQEEHIAKFFNICKYRLSDSNP